MNLPSEWLEIHPWSVPFSAISPQPSDRSQHGQFTASSETSLHHLLLATGNSWFLWKVHVNAPLKKLGDTGIPNLKQCENNLSTCWSMCAFLMYSTGGPIGPTNPRRLELVVKHGKTCAMCDFLVVHITELFKASLKWTLDIGPPASSHVLTGDEDTTPSVPWKPALPGANLRVWDGFEVITMGLIVWKWNSGHDTWSGLKDFVWSLRTCLELAQLAIECCVLPGILVILVIHDPQPWLPDWTWSTARMQCSC